MKRATAFWDASSLVPLFVYETTTSSAAAYLKKFAPIVWWGSSLEVQSAICRLHREQTITAAGKSAAISRLESLSGTLREVSPSDKLRELAFDLLSYYPLKSGDSLQLAASLIWCEQRPARRNFVCADQRLSRTARSIGFAVLELSGASSRV